MLISDTLHTPNAFPQELSVRIVTGTYRGRRIPSGNSLGDIRLTSTRLKEAVFSMLGPDLDGQTFLDLCAGSGQIGLEALSRGATVELNEPDRRRLNQIRSLLYEWRAGVAALHSAKAQALIPSVAGEDRRFDIIYADPPYHARYAGSPLLLGLIEALGESTLLNEDGLFFAQHQTELSLPESSGRLQRTQQRTYGNTALAIYQLA
ncbi:MAG: 16S rRNA (guanine(966)-N(2))-methyltransferase RsmD [Candidatus Latescibacterota bacterium]|jgi:16S rRNA (guanine(966)-N(2))-methyltransferase RsmD|nr:16S rRNA (guanine(966)-N(2))-methyltransferase RsmD [Candidatus Latescibacterota bacterium]